MVSIEIFQLSSKETVPWFRRLWAENGKKKKIGESEEKGKFMGIYSVSSA